MLSALQHINFVRRFTSLRFTLFLIGLLCLAILPGTFTESRAIYSHPLFLALLAVFGVQLTLCTLSRWRSLGISTLVIHGSIIVTLIGGLVSSFGYVATVNIYDGSSVDKVYRWDKQRDVSLGPTLSVRKINREYYPVPVRIGVRKGQEKLPLFTLSTGQSFRIGDYQVKVGHFDADLDKVRLDVLQNGVNIGFAETDGVTHLPPSFPYTFTLVAYVNPVLRHFWVDLDLLQNGKVIASGTTAVNHPFQWNGLYFYNTQIDRDTEGRFFAGIQIVRDPGRPIVFTGMTLLAIGSLLAFYRRFYRPA